MGLIEDRAGNPILEEDGKLTCPECRALGVHEHKCFRDIEIPGRPTAKCSCECQRTPTEESLNKWMSEGYPSEFKFEYATAE